MRPKQDSQHTKLTQISLDPSEGYYFVYENGTVARVLKSDLREEEPKAKKPSNFWAQFLSTVDLAVKEEQEE